MIKERLAAQQLTRILAFGSSNTERRVPGMHWFDCLDLALHQQFGRHHRCINTGVGGHTTRDLLQRFDADARLYQPHTAFLTIGGNDSNPDKNMTEEEFETNLLELWTRFQDMGTAVIFQTYYAVQTNGSERFLKFFCFMDVIRKVARDTGSLLIDHLERWELLRMHHPELYNPLMLDDFHIIDRGNRIMGVDIIRTFGLAIRSDLDVWGEALYIQRLMDDLQAPPA